MNKMFTYIIGAGASKNVLPLVKDLGNRLQNYLDFLTNTTRLNNSVDLIELTSLIKQDLKWLIKEEDKHASIDTFAKKLYLTGHPKLKTLKSLLDAYFTTYQSLGETDKRYDAFLASILTGTNAANIALPSNINILSWNYDSQIELSLANFFMTNKIEDLERKCKFIPNSQSDYIIADEFSLIKLNGTAGGLIVDEKNFLRKKNFTLIDDNNIDDNADDLFNQQVQMFIDVIKNYNISIADEKSISSIMFAWEKNTLVSSIRQYTNKKIKDTSILTVIGYSFPTFNREIDKEILNNMPQLDKIIIQAPIKDIDSIEFRIRSLLDPVLNVTIEKNSSIDEFFIPFEFN